MNGETFGHGGQRHLFLNRTGSILEQGILDF